jgi:hypothetical protein
VAGNARRPLVAFFQIRTREIIADASVASALARSLGGTSTRPQRAGLAKAEHPFKADIRDPTSICPLSARSRLMDCGK